MTSLESRSHRRGRVRRLSRGEVGKLPESPSPPCSTRTDRAQSLAERHGACAFADAASLFEAVDVVSIASPAQTHAAVALKALAAGRPVYVEKPMAVDLDDADAIAAAAARRGLAVACGFLERAAFEAMGLFDVPEPPLP